jgi:hypothetical protein
MNIRLRPEPEKLVSEEVRRSMDEKKRAWLVGKRKG